MIHSKHNKLNMTAMSKVMLIVLLANAKRSGSLKEAGKAAGLFFIGIAAVVFVEYALDKLEFIPVLVLYGLMAAALAFMGMTAERQRKG